MGVLEDFGTGLAAVPPLLLVVGHCTFVSLLTRGLREKFLLSFWVRLLWSLYPTRCPATHKETLTRGQPRQVFEQLPLTPFSPLSFHYIRELDSRRYMMAMIQRLSAMQVGLFAAVGGGVVSGYLLQDTRLAPNPIFSGNAIIGTWTVCWWAINYCPYSLVAGIAAILPIRAACRVRNADPDTCMLRTISSQ